MFILIKLSMHLLLGKVLNICDNKQNRTTRFFGNVQKPKFKQSKGGEGGLKTEIEKFTSDKVLK